MSNYDNDVAPYKVPQGRDMNNRRTAKRNLRTDEPPKPFARRTVSDLKKYCCSVRKEITCHLPRMSLRSIRGYQCFAPTELVNTTNKI